LDRVIVVKIGGAILGSDDTSFEDIAYLQRQGKSLVVVHGGGKLITEWLEKQKIASRFVQGERVTDMPTLEVAIAVLSGLVNKAIVAAINDAGGNAVGISGVDGAFIQGRIKNKELGYVGEVEKVNLALLTALLQAGYVPIVSPISLLSLDKPEQGSRILNINADVVAGEVAAAIGAESLIFMTDVTGIVDQSGELIPGLSITEAEALIASGVASGGMIPKIKACLRALSTTPITCIIDGRQPHALLREMKEGNIGTRIQ